MAQDEPTYFESREALRAWLLANHDTADELELGIYKAGAGHPSVAYIEAVEEGLCFGWVDGVRHSVDELRYRQRFTPRRKGSNWSAVNIKRFEALQAQGLVHESGQRVFDERDLSKSQDAHEQSNGLEEPYLSQMQAREKAWSFFSSQAPWYQRTAGLWVMSAKREETRQRRLAILIEDSEAGRRIGPVRREGQP